MLSKIINGLYMYTNNNKYMSYSLVISKYLFVIRKYLLLNTYLLLGNTYLLLLTC